MFKKYLIILWLCLGFQPLLFSLTQIKAEQDKMLSIQPILKESNFTLVESTVLGYLFLKMDLTNAVETAGAVGNLAEKLKEKNKSKEFIDTLSLLKISLEDPITQYDFAIKVLHALFQEAHSRNYKEEALDKILADFSTPLFGSEYKEIMKNIFLPSKNNMPPANFRSALMRSLQETQDDIRSSRSKLDLLIPILNKSKESLQTMFQDQQKELDALKSSYYSTLRMKKPEPVVEEIEES